MIKNNVITDQILNIVDETLKGSGESLHYGEAYIVLLVCSYMKEKGENGKYILTICKINSRQWSIQCNVKIVKINLSIEGLYKFIVLFVREHKTEYLWLRS